MRRAETTPSPCSPRIISPVKYCRRGLFVGYVPNRLRSARSLSLNEDGSDRTMMYVRMYVGFMRFEKVSFGLGDYCWCLIFFMGRVLSGGFV